MFTTEELQSIDRKYFTVIVADAFDVTLISNNTRHVWYIISTKSVTSITAIPGVEHFGRRSGISSLMMNFN